ncbi:hydroxymethylglutaryl-CoA reductase, degradative [Lactococcus hircilactis]|uniref:3-hydroxy-3-methylglutaryl coenzyme A reductase n=1 Tax=Lactococcus hircilactis TaxID=1494462 RepID=A0A7X1Z9M6_9LACT|nr:hydroxymethylglutaryl-CoA reductase, degradative [Lactococcus hircilactis]MQW39257.1 hydroxymethylglutaryl-CoA reductase, degradative [Lactococcus hircilactis]
MNKKFYQMTLKERLDHLNLSADSRAILEQTALDAVVANNLIENQISEFEIPLGLAQNFVINDKKILIPMATEEPSVIAAASNGARMAQSFVAEISQRLMRGQIVFYDVKNLSVLTEKIATHHDAIFKKAQEAYPSIVKRGGGLRHIDSRFFDSGFLSIDFQIDVKDAMGANIVNAILEGVSALFYEWFPDEKILFSILSNYATESLVTVTCEIPVERLSKTGDGLAVAKKIERASQFAKLDAYRAATHNKGIMNGIEAVVIATGNDSRAVNAAVHAYAARSGTYQGLGDWSVSADKLFGTLTLPLAVASVGGGTKVLEKAKVALEIMQITDAQSLAKTIAAVGLAQNLAALRALVSEGIQKGHMSLQARSLALSVGASGDEVSALTQLLRQEKKMNQALAASLLKKLREKKK